MTAGLFLSAAASGAIVVLTPGPAVLAFLAIGSAQGRWAGARFILGHLAGDLLWGTLALAALAGAQAVAPGVFRLLALFCGLYLAWLGSQALATRRGGKRPSAFASSRPLRRGLLFGVTNPKGYPVTLSVFGALLIGEIGNLTLATLPLLLLSLFAGFLAADAVLVWLVGTATLVRLYTRHELWIIRGTGLLFLCFAANTIFHAAFG